MTWRWKLLLGLSFVLGAGCQRDLPGPHAGPHHAHAGPAVPAAPKPAAAPAPMAGVHEVAIRNFVYEPASLSIRVGESVRFTNYDAAPHDAVAYTGSWKTPLLKVNESATQVYGEKGVFPYYCTVHPAMRGTVEVQGPSGP